MKTWIAVFCVASVVAGPGVAWGQSTTSGVFVPETTSETFVDGEMVSDGTYYYLVGGLQSGSITASYFTYARVRRYDTATNSWIDLPMIASGATTWGTSHHSSVYHNGRLYVFGGYVYTGTTSGTTTTWALTGYTNAIRAYSFATGTWSTLGAVLSGGQRYSSAAAVASTPLGSRIYIMGGPALNLNDEFNPTTDTVTPRAALPNAAIYHRVVTAPGGDSIYLMGGVQNGGASANCHEYTPPSTATGGGTWAARAPITINGVLQPRYFHQAAVLNGRVYLFGGFATIGGITTGTLTTVEYNPGNDSWAQRYSSIYLHYRFGGAAANNKAFVYGGLGNAQTNGEEFTPPEFGAKPNAPTLIAQVGSQDESSLQALPDANQVNGWTSSSMTFSGVITDPNAGQQVRLRVQVKPQQASWSSASQIISLDSGLRAQGQVTVTCALPTGGAYDWRWRVEDALTNSYPDASTLLDKGWMEAFGNTLSPDFRSDQVPPVDPVPVSPSDVDLHVPDPNFGEVHLRWIESTDNGPVSGISYEIQVAREGGFNDIEAQLFSTAGTDTYPITLSSSRFEKFWRIRARDVGGNFSPWSTALTFRVTYDDTVNHSAGDAKRMCGMSASAGSPGIAWVGLLIFGLMLIRRNRG